MAREPRLPVPSNSPKVVSNSSNPVSKSRSVRGTPVDCTPAAEAAAPRRKLAGCTDQRHPFRMSYRPGSSDSNPDCPVNSPDWEDMQAAALAALFALVVAPLAAPLEMDKLLVVVQPFGPG